MKRTQSRPIPAQKISPESARDFGIWLSVLSVMTLALASNYLAAFLLAFTIFFYAVIYTIYLKRTTPQNIVIGGLAGALPPVVSAAAMSGSITIESLALCAIIFLWTPPHFWALALVKKEDYKAVGIPMYPNTKGDFRTVIEILIYNVLLFAATMLPIYLGFGGILYSLFAIGFGLYYFFTSLQIYLSMDKNHFHKKCMKGFFTSIFYLFGLFLSLMIERFFIFL